MAARRRATVGRSAAGQAYVYGNTARAVQPAPSVTQQRQKKAAELERQAEQYRRMNHRVRRNQEKALQMDLPYVLMLTIAAACALFICVSYLHMQATISARITHIEQLEQEVENLRSENDALQTRINTEIDLDHVYQVATEELGMVYANRDQVILYDKTESEYVRQYEDIPEY